MLFKNEKPRHITFALKEISRKMPIKEELEQEDNEEPSVFKSTNLSRKIRLKPISHNYNIDVIYISEIQNGDSELVLPKLGNRSSLKQLNILTQNIVEETEKEVQKKLLKHTMKDINKNIKININIENININKNTLFVREDDNNPNKEGKIRLIKFNNNKFIKVANNYKYILF